MEYVRAKGTVMEELIVRYHVRRGKTVQDVFLNGLNGVNAPSIVMKADVGLEDPENARGIAADQNHVKRKKSAKSVQFMKMRVNLKNGLIGPNVGILAEKEPGNVLAQTNVPTEKDLTKWKRKQNHAKITLIATVTLNLGLVGLNALQAVEKESKLEKGIV